jgi:SAM-dependent methyltransferase
VGDGSVKGARPLVRTGVSAIVPPLSEGQVQRPRGANLTAPLPIVDGASFAAQFDAVARAPVPSGTVQLLEGLAPSPDLARIVALQHEINQEASLIATAKMAPDAKTTEKGYRAKQVLKVGASHVRPGSSRLRIHKALPGELVAREAEYNAIMYRLLGAPLPLALHHVYDDRVGVSSRFLDHNAPIPQVDFSKLSPEAHEQLIRIRLAAQVVGNLHQHWGHLLFRTSPAGRIVEAQTCDTDECRNRIPAERLQYLLKSVYQIERPVDECRYMSEHFAFSNPIGWAPQSYDTRHFAYAKYWRDYVQGRFDLDIDGIKRRLASDLEALPKPVLENAAKAWFQAIEAQTNERFVYNQAAPRGEDPRIDFEAWIDGLHDRIQRAPAEFGAFLDALKEARKHPEHPLYAALDRPDDQFTWGQVENDRPWAPEDWYGRDPAGYADYARSFLRKTYPNPSHPGLGDIPLLDRVLELAPGRVGFDAGCGPSARHMEFLANERGCTMYGIDAVSENIGEVKSSRPKLGDRVAVQDLTKPFRLPPAFPKTFDFAICKFVIQHIDRPKLKAALQHITSRLREGGILELDFKSGKGIHTATDKVLGRDRTFLLYEPDRILAMLKGMGMELVQEDGDKLGGKMGFMADTVDAPTTIFILKKTKSS